MLSDLAANLRVELHTPYSVGDEALLEHFDLRDRWLAIQCWLLPVFETRFYSASSFSQPCVSPSFLFADAVLAVRALRGGRVGRSCRSLHEHAVHLHARADRRQDDLVLG